MYDPAVLEALEQFGLSSKEISIYLATLSLGTATANDIANRADINRSTTYDILKAFLEKGIASKIIREGATNFEVATPQQLVTILEEKKARLNEVMPQLELIKQAIPAKPTVELYEGDAGIVTALQGILRNARHIDVISTSKVFDVITYAFPKYIEQRTIKGITARVIQEESIQTRQLKRTDKHQYRETRSITGFTINSMTFIHGDTVTIIKLSKQEPISIIIHDPDLATDQKKIFEQLWSKAT